MLDKVAFSGILWIWAEGLLGLYLLRRSERLLAARQRRLWEHLHRTLEASFASR